MTCPSCGDAAAAKLVLRAHGSRLVRCRACSLVRVDPMPPADQAEALYSDAYFRDPVKGYVDYAADEAVYRAEFRRRLRVIRAAGGRGRLLDVGCATGGLLVEAKAAGFQVSGIEPAPETAREAAVRAGCGVLAGTLRGALLAPAAYEVITLFDVLEHMTDVGAALKRLRLALLPRGMLAVTVPDFGGLFAQASGARWPFLTPWEHLVYFSRRTLRGALLRAGFETVTFHPACTPVSYGTLAAKTPLPAALVPEAWKHRGLGLPFGTLFALAR